MWASVLRALCNDSTKTEESMLVKRISSKSVLALVAALILAAPALVQAQEDEGTQSEQGEQAEAGNGAERQADESSESEKAEEENEDAEQRRGRNDSFVPSEQISDDLSVSFPVDI